MAEIIGVSVPDPASLSLTSGAGLDPNVHVPESLRDVDRFGAVVRTLEYDDDSVIAVDFGTDGATFDVDVVDSTAIVVTGDDQFEFELPPEATDVSIRNGVLTIEE